jgi:hypothetical protein
MKATITSTTEVVEIIDIVGNRAFARVWEGVSEKGVPFTAYITSVQVRSNADCSQFAAELKEHKPPEPETRRAIDLRFII